MKNFTNKVDGTSTLAANGANSFLAEMENLVLQSGQSLDETGESGVDPDTQQLARAMVTAVAQAGSYEEDSSSTAALRILNTAGEWTHPTGYVDLMVIRFQPMVANTGAVQINVGGLGAVDLADQDGTALSAGDMLVGTFITAQYTLASNEFRIVAAESAAVCLLYTSPSPRDS